MKLLFWRKPKLPAARRPPLARDERVLAWAVTAHDEQTLVATNLGLWMPDAEGRLGWHEIHKATWTGREFALVPATVVATLGDYEVTADLPSRAFSLPVPGDLPHQVRTRVTKSVSYSTQRPLPGGGGARVVARRVPGIDGLRWAVRLDPPADIDDPVVRELVNGYVEAAKVEINQ